MDTVSEVVQDYVDTVLYIVVQDYADKDYSNRRYTLTVSLSLQGAIKID